MRTSGSNWPKNSALPVSRITRSSWIEETLTLFAVQKLGENNTAADLPNSPVVRKWWDFMAPLMEVQPDNAPVARPLEEVFHLD